MRIYKVNNNTQRGIKLPIQAKHYGYSSFLINCLLYPLFIFFISAYVSCMTRTFLSVSKSVCHNVFWKPFIQLLYILQIYVWNIKFFTLKIKNINLWINLFISRLCFYVYISWFSKFLKKYLSKHTFYRYTFRNVK